MGEIFFDNCVNVNGAPRMRTPSRRSGAWSCHAPGGDGCARSAGGRAAVCGAPAGRVPVLGRFHHRRTPCLCAGFGGPASRYCGWFSAERDMSSRKWATVLRAAGRGPLGSRSSLDGDSMTTAEPWWARVQQPHVARRTNRANTVRQLRTIVLPSYQTWCTARRAAQRFGAPLASPIARKQGVGSIQITDGLPIALAFAPACCLAAAPGAGHDRGDGQGSPARRPVDPSWARFPQNDPACALALGTASITPFSAHAHHLVVWPEPRVVPATTGAASKNSPLPVALGYPQHGSSARPTTCR